MKFGYLLSICLLVLLSSSTTSAATLKWRYRLPASFSGLPQILADSSGNGVAFVYSTTDPDTGQPGYSVVTKRGKGDGVRIRDFQKVFTIDGGFLRLPDGKGMANSMKQLAIGISLDRQNSV